MQYSWEILEEKKKDGIIQAYMADDEQPRKDEMILQKKPSLQEQEQLA